MSNKTIERIFQAAALVLMLGAAYFLWLHDYERVFVLAVVGSLSFLIGLRFQVKQRLVDRENGALTTADNPASPSESE